MWIEVVVIVLILDILVVIWGLRRMVRDMKQHPDVDIDGVDLRIMNDEGEFVPLTGVRSFEVFKAPSSSDGEMNEFFSNLREGMPLIEFEVDWNPVTFVICPLCKSEIEDWVNDYEATMKNHLMGEHGFPARIFEDYISTEEMISMIEGYEEASDEI